MKKALFYKHFYIKASFSILAISSLIALPSPAQASFFSDLIDNVFGQDTQAAETAPVQATPAIVHNSQNVPLLESSINPDLKNMKDDPIPEAPSPADATLLASSGSLDTDSDLEKYASSEKITTYTVKKGDTIESISKKLNVPQSTIIASNADLKKSDLLKIGQKLVILGNQSPVPEKAKTDTAKTPAKEDPIPKKDDSKEKDDGPVYVINTDLSPFTPPVIENTPTPVAPTINLPIGGAPEPTVPAQPSGQPAGTINGDYIWPFAPGVGRISQGLHADQAYDFAAPKDTPILAIQNGTVFIVHATGYNGGYGKYVVINFDDGRQAIFGHMNKTNVQEGQIVKQGDVIGFVGTTGQSTGYHTHIGFRGALGNPYKGLKVNSTSVGSHD